MCQMIWIVRFPFIYLCIIGNVYMTNLKTSQFSYHKDTNCFTAEVSELGNIGFGTHICLTNPKTHRSKVFSFTHKDTDGESDIYGWNFKSDDGIKLLIIND